VDFDAIGQLLIMYSAFVTNLKKKMEIQLSSASAIYKHQESAMIQLGGRSCVYSQWVWYPHETGKANKNVSE